MKNRALLILNHKQRAMFCFSLIYHIFVGLSAKKHTPMFKQLLEKVESIDVYTSVSEQIMVAKSSEELKLLLKFSPDEKYAVHKRLVILEFVASWCGLCKQVSLGTFLL